LRTVFCHRCGQRFPDDAAGSSCYSCKVQQRQQSQKILLASGLIVLFVLVLTSFLAVQISENARKAVVRQQSYFERFARRMEEKRIKEKEQEAQLKETNHQIDEWNQGRFQKIKNAEPDFGPYIGVLQRRLRRNWKPPHFKREQQIKVIFRIRKDGELSTLTIQQSSGSAESDAAALAAVRASTPFPALPSNYRGKDVPVQFTFDYEINRPSKK
jgi:TonB family protein